MSELFKCNECTKTFRLKGQLKKHERQVHEKKNVTCEICNKSFVSQGQLKRHTTSNHSDTSHKVLCSICGKTFSSEYIKNHEKRHYDT